MGTSTAKTDSGKPRIGKVEPTGRPASRNSYYTRYNLVNSTEIQMRSCGWCSPVSYSNYTKVELLGLADPSSIHFLYYLSSPSSEEMTLRVGPFSFFASAVAT